MAATKKSAKRSSTKKRPQAKRQSPKKKSAARKGAATGRSKMTTIPGAAGLKRQARKGLKAARGGLGSVLQVGEKTWETLKNTTAQVVEGVKETFVGEPRPVSRRPRSR